MDIQTLFDNAIAASRAKTLQTSPQLTLGELIAKCEAIYEKQTEDKTVCFDFEYLYPTGIHSWRGAYNELALNFNSEDEGSITLEAFLTMLKDSLGKEFEGWKGGEFTMHKNTPIWVAKPNHSGNTGVVNVIDNNYNVILVTGYCEY